jgi:hypothetical protein
VSEIVDLIVANPVMPAVKVLVGHLARDARVRCCAGTAHGTEPGAESRKLIQSFDAVMAAA